jgi:GNAT superfamily N-acetyltransferase
MSAKNIVIRTMAVTDVVAVTDLSAQLGYACSVTETAERITQLLSSEQDYIVVADLDGIVAGWMHIFKTLRLEAGAYVEIAALVVNEQYRGNKIGEQLVREAHAWTQKQGINKMVVRSNVLRERAHHFYTRYGFIEKKTQKVFELER